MATRVGKQRGAARAQPGDSHRPNSHAGNPLISDAKLKQILATMLQCRALGQHLKRARNKARGGYKLSPLQEAVAVGAAIDLRREDWIAPSRGDFIAGLVKGAPLTAIFSQFGSDDAIPRTTSAKGRSAAAIESCSQLHVIPYSATAAAQINIAAGVALAMRTRKHGDIVMAFVHGPISDAPLHDALNFVGAQCLPVVVVVQINAASVRRKGGPANLVDRSHACGFPIIPVAAHDVVAMYRVAHESIHKARHGGGPTLIEATTFPILASHPGADARGGRFPDAIGKMEDYLSAKGLLSAAWKQKVLDRFNRDLESAIGSARPAPLRKPDRNR